MTETPALDQPLAELVRMVRDGELAPDDPTKAALQRTARLEPQVHAWVLLDPAAEETAARRGPGPLQAVPIAVKDIIDVAGLPSRCGSTITSPEPVPESAACIRALESLGAVVLGKSVTTEFAYFAPGPTDNPAAPGHTPGGSSSGSAAAVAAGMVPLAVGSQTAGSLTRPAAFCGIAGMVLAQGTTDLTGITGLSHSFDSLGLLARRVEDLAHAYEALVSGGFATMAGDCAPPSPGRPVDVCLWHGSELDEISPAMAEAVETAGRLLEGAGVPVQELDWDDHIQTLTGDHITIMSYEAARLRTDALARLDEVSQPLAELLQSGQQIADADYQAARIRCDRSLVELGAVLARTGVVVGPAALGPAPAGLAATGSPVLSRPWQALGLPAVTVPGIRCGAGRPLGLQVIGMPGCESRVLGLAAQLQDLLSGLRTDAWE